MREIKFRFWRDNRMQIAHQLNAYVNSDNNFSGDGEVLMQFTGLRDRNGREIYEGDIYQVAKNVIYRVVFVGTPEVFEDEALMGGFGLQNDWRGILIAFDTYAVEHGEVIGNIYENPELLNNQ